MRVGLMTQTTGADADEEEIRRVDVELLIRHPSLTPPEIAAALGLEGHFTHCVGDRRKTPKGTLLEGVYAETSWRHGIRHELRTQHFAAKVAELVDRLLPHRAFLHKLHATGGSAEIIVQFLGDGYHGDDLPVETLAKMVDLQLDLGLEVFTVPQNKPAFD